MVDLVTLERIAARGWQGTRTERLGDWLLRAGGGFTGRANSVLPLGSPGVDLDTALSAVQDFYQRESVPALFQVPFDAGVRSVLTDELAVRGWSSFNESAVLTAPLSAAQLAFPRSRVGVFRHEAVPSAGWLGGYHYRGAGLPSNAVAVLINAETPTFLSLWAGDDLLGVARGVVTDGWLGVTAVTVAEQHRRRGIGSALMAELLHWAAARGAEHAYLQVDTANTAALSMYARGGFTEHHRYHYLRLP